MSKHLEFFDDHEHNISEVIKMKHEEILKKLDNRTKSIGDRVEIINSLSLRDTEDNYVVIPKGELIVIADNQNNVTRVPIPGSQLEIKQDLTLIKIDTGDKYYVSSKEVRRLDNYKF
ncbi:MAG: hypothetical protein ACOC33_04155 [bacterium]